MQTVTGRLFNVVQPSQPLTLIISLDYRCTIFVIHPTYFATALSSAFNPETDDGLNMHGRF